MSHSELNQPQLCLFSCKLNMRLDVWCGERAGSYAGGCAETMLDMKYPHTALDVITDYPPPSLITSARMNHE